MKNKIKIFIVLFILIFASLACGTTTSQELSDAAKQATATQIQGGAAVQPTLVPSATIQAPTPTSQPTIEPTSPASELKLGEQIAFFQDNQALTTIFFVENPNKDQAIENSQFQVAVYDDAGSVLKAESGYMEIVLPGERLPQVVETYLNEGQKASKVEVQIKSGKANNIDVRPPLFQVSQVQFQPDPMFPKITGVIQNSFQKDISNIKVSSIAYDATGKIIGGGFTFVNFLPAGGKTAVDVTSNIQGTPDKVELYPTLSSLSSLEESKAQSSPLQVVAQGFSQSTITVSFAFLVENKDTIQAIENSQYQVAAYDENGGVLATGDGYINMVFPGEKLGVATDLYLPEGKKAAKVEVQLMPGSLTKTDQTANPFTVENIKFFPDPNFPKVTGMVLNSLNKDVKSIEAFAVAYDDKGNIIGGGLTFIDFIPANNKTAVEIMLSISGNPAKVELYPTYCSLTTVGE